VDIGRPGRQFDPIARLNAECGNIDRPEEFSFGIFEFLSRNRDDSLCRRLDPH
jgi:hypothetical protein